MKKNNGQNKKITFVCIFTLFLVILISNSSSNAMEFIFKDPQYSFQSLRTIGYTCSGDADIGECLSTVYHIKEGNDESWYAEWIKTARRLEKVAGRFLNEVGRTFYTTRNPVMSFNYLRWCALN